MFIDDPMRTPGSDRQRSRARRCGAEGRCGPARCSLALAALTSVAVPVHADEVRVFVAGAAKAALERIAPEYARATGDTIVAVADTVGALRDRISGGERPDATILSNAAIDALAARGIVAADARREIGVVVSGLAVQRGAPLPDVSSPEALRRALLAAKSIAHADGARGATSGAHFAKVIDQLGLREQLRERIVVLPFGVDAIQGVADGKFDLGASQSSEIVPHAGVSFVGGQPPPYALTTAYTAAAVSGSAKGAALLRYLDSAAARAHFAASGFTAP